MMIPPVILVLRAAPDALSLLFRCTFEPGVDIVYVRDGEAAIAAIANRSVALFVIDQTTQVDDLHELMPVFAENGFPLLFLLAGDDLHSISALKNDFPGITADFLIMPTDLQSFNNRLEMLLLLSEKSRLLLEKEHELNDKSLELEVLRAEIGEKNAMLEAFSSRDSLTGLFNRKYFEDNLAKEWKQGVRSSSSLALLLIEVDHFQAYSECYGPLEGDDCLRQVGLALYEALLRPVDIIARYDGEKFAAMLPDTDTAGMELVAARMINNIKEMALANEYSAAGGVVTVSIGGSVLVPGKKADHISLIDAAYESLQEARAAGGNRSRMK